MEILAVFMLFVGIAMQMVAFVFGILAEIWHGMMGD
jgi:hypothetical protein